MTPLQQVTVVAVIVISVLGFGISAVKQTYHYIAPTETQEELR